MFNVKLWLWSFICPSIKLFLLHVSPSKWFSIHFFLENVNIKLLFEHGMPHLFAEKRVIQHTYKFSRFCFQMPFTILKIASTSPVNTKKGVSKQLISKKLNKMCYGNVEQIAKILVSKNWCHTLKCYSRWLKVVQNTSTTLYLIMQVTGSKFIKYFRSYDSLMMLEILRRQK